MVTSTRIKDYPYLEHPENYLGIDQRNALYLRQWIRQERASGIKLITLDRYVLKVYLWLRDMGFKDAKKITSEDVLDVFLCREDRVSNGKYAKSTLDIDVIVLTKFFKFLVGTERAAELVPIKRRQTKNLRFSSDYVSMDQIRMMREEAAKRGDIRGIALLMLCIGTGARIGEILGARIKDLSIKQYNGVLHVDGKTGAREIPFVIGLPELLTWISVHPCRLPDGKVDPDAPIFCTFATRGHTVHAMSIKTAEEFFAHMKDLAGIPKDVKANPHAFRHRMATHLARNLTIKEMNMYFGWSPYSTMALTYIHTSRDELEKSILKINGITPPAAEPEKPMALHCPSCNHVISMTTTWCPHCRQILDPVLAVRFASSPQKLESIQENPVTVLYS
ncbi:MAG TPA: tyrosine-type recombinase/integrase [Methanocorpusculum sp.]|nr:tyrosine-type recombinase/integrase [Methanocorpusculum sp.]HJK04022.1 tyrosine-type recombinase/integrase [Methanocorpusculum sp.]HJK06206.1 tyrosine-type recombinase/integrase [Methanocorpusculum sp.]HJK15210.1 tyrosine-type recombinase/integrase [Methanocorpusculum sp.]HJK16949.1 tyrosine-type recombinase/integrase [Methanocorpusculum sp.]